MHNRIQDFKTLIAQGKVEKVINEMLPLLKNTEHEQVILLISQSIHNIKSQALSGLISDEDERVQKAKISKRILDLLDMVLESDLKYKYKSDIRTITTNISNQDLVIDIARAFIQFFTCQYGIKLKMEIVHEDDKMIQFFYFADDKNNELTKAKFEKYLSDSQAEYFEVLNRKL